MFDVSPLAAIGFSVSYIALWILVLFQALVLLDVVREQTLARGQQGPSSSEIGSQLDTGTLAPGFESPDLNTGANMSSGLFRGRLAVLAFVSPTCKACELVGAELHRFGRSVDGRLLLICRGDTESCRDFTQSRFDGLLAIADPDNVIGNSFRVKGAPTIVILDQDWRVLRYGFPRTAPTLDLESLVDEVEERREIAVGTDGR